MNRVTLLLLLSLGGVSLQAQSFSTITISTVPAGARFYVDGLQYTRAASFNWPTGSKHVLEFPTDSLLTGTGGAVQTSPEGTIGYGFAGWVDNATLTQVSTDPVQTITANPAITTLTATLAVSYRVYLNLYNSGNPADGGTPPACGAPGGLPAGQFRPGVVVINSTCYWSSSSVFVQANSKITINAFPYPGFVFLGWAMNSGPLNPYLTSLTVQSPMSLAPQFAPGKRVHFLTSPLGLNVLIDHTTVPTRTDGSNLSGPCPSNESLPVSQLLAGFPSLCFGDFDFASGSSHVISGVSPQLDSTGKWWVFNNWSNGTGANATYTTDNNTATPDALTANFIPGAQVSLLTNPSGLQLSVDGRQNWPSLNFIWGLGSTHQIAAIPAQFDSKGRQYTFQGWSNKASASQTLTVDQTAVTSGMRVTANYSVLSRVVVQSSPAGQTVQVDGTSCQTPCNIDRASGSQVHLTAASQIPMGASARLEFTSWSDGGGADHTLSIDQDLTTVTVSYINSYQLNAGSDPGNGVSFQFSPASSDMFYPQNTQVSVTASPNPGFKFRRWAGDLSGTYPGGVINMAGPRTVIAQMDTVPYIAPAGVRNAVGDTPTSAVAPGSIISIFGQGLAPQVKIGPVNPLSQTLAGVTVTVNDRILPLLFVSPEQINAEVLSDIPDGDYTLLVHVTGQADISTTFSVARNAPGLFFQTMNSQRYVVAFHPDGSIVTPDNPANGGETISILGTGFGPYAGKVIDGFFPPAPPPSLSDSVAITTPDQTLVPTWTGAASGFTGVVSTTFQVPNGLLSGSNVPLTVMINGAASNTVMLPVQ